MILAVGYGLKGISAGNDSFKVKFRFVENTSQNEFQGDKLQLKWTFEAQQGELRS